VDKQRIKWLAQCAALGAILVLLVVGQDAAWSHTAVVTGGGAIVGLLVGLAIGWLTRGR
jgi:hypothetical protein